MAINIQHFVPVETLAPDSPFDITNALAGKNFDEVYAFIQAGVMLLHKRGKNGYAKGSGKRHHCAQNTIDACRAMIDRFAPDGIKTDYVLQAWAYASRQLADNLDAQRERNRRG